MEALDTLHKDLQSKLQEATSISDLLPYIEATQTLEGLKVTISAALAQQLSKEKKQIPTDSPSKESNADHKSKSDTQNKTETKNESKPKTENKTNPDTNTAHKDQTPDSSTPAQESQSVLKSLYTAITTAKLDAKESKSMKPRTIDDDAKSEPKSRNNSNFRPERRDNYGRGGPPAWSTSVCYNCGNKGHFARECPNKGGGGGGGRGGGRQRFGGGGGGGGQRRYNNQSNLRCYHCGKDGHFARDCPEESNDELNEKCFRCGKMGHWARDCSQPPSQGRGNRGGGNRGGNRGFNDNDRCHRCGKNGHWAKDCDQPYQNNFRDKDNDKCNRCGKMGHWARDCELPRNDGYGDDDY